MQAEGTFDDSSNMIITDRVNWRSSDTGVATVSNAEGSRGLVTGEDDPFRFGAPDSATITAEDAATGVSGSATVFVNP